MISAEQLHLWTVDKLKQQVREERSIAKNFNDRVRLAKRLLAAADEPELEHLVVDEVPIPTTYEEPVAEALTTVGPSSTIRVCEWTQSSACDDPGHVSCPAVIVTHRSGDEFIGYMPDGFFDEPKKITFELKHICYVEEDGAGETRNVI